MSKADRKFKRENEARRFGESSKLYKAALKEGAKMEQHFKNTINKMPWWKRQVLGYKIMKGTWK